MTTSVPSEGLRVDLRVRGPVPYGAREAVRRVQTRLESLAEAGRVDEVTVDTWEKHVPVTPGAEVAPAEETMRETVAEFERWAQEHGHDLRPAFEERTVTGHLDGEDRDVVVLPVVTLALYAGAELRAVYPCTDDGEVETVTDCLEALEAEVTHGGTPTGIDGSASPVERPASR